MLTPLISTEFMTEKASVCAICSSTRSMPAAIQLSMYPRKSSSQWNTTDISLMDT